MKPRIKDESKEDKFKRIASARTSRILENLRLLGNCANTSSYAYRNEDVDKIFSAIEKELKRVKTLYTKTKTEFSL